MKSRKQKSSLPWPVSLFDIFIFNRLIIVRTKNVYTFLDWLLYLFHLHKWKRIGSIKSIKKPYEHYSFADQPEYLGYYALGKCIRCKAEAFLRCYGNYRWNYLDLVTFDEYLEAYKEKIQEGRKQFNQDFRKKKKR